MPNHEITGVDRHILKIMMGQRMKAQFDTLRTNLTVRAVRVKVRTMRREMIEMAEVTTPVVMRWCPILVVHFDDIT